MTQAADARLAMLACAAEEMFDAAYPAKCPIAHPLLGELGWTLKGHLTAVDALTGIGVRAYYGFLATCGASTYAIVVRGTQSVLEWLKDAEFALTPHPVAGCVETGFWSIYETMRYRTLSGFVRPLLPGLLAEIGAGQVTVIGHSLGAPIATYLQLDLNSIPSTGISTSGRFFASPRPGDVAFATIASAALTDYCVYAYEEDLVPKVPIGFGYRELANLVTLPTSGDVARTNPAAWHHSTTYGYLLDPSVLSLIPSPYRTAILKP
jgi:triacylglycerol lipase